MGAKCDEESGQASGGIGKKKNVMLHTTGSKTYHWSLAHSLPHHNVNLWTLLIM